MSNKYRKKPVVVEAMQIPYWTPDITEEYAMQLAELVVWLGVGGPWRMVADKGIDIDTLEGTMHGSQGDFIIKGISGEFYPCKPDIFEKTYEPVND